MRKTRSSSKSLLEALISPFNKQEHDDPESLTKLRLQGLKRSSDVVFASFLLLMLSSWGLYQYQFGTLPEALTAEQAGERGFSEAEALKHVQALASLGPHSVGSDALDHAVKYVLGVAETMKTTSNGELEVEVERFHVDFGVNRVDSGRFTGKTLIYSDTDQVIVRISPTNVTEARDNAILVSAHIDTVFAAEGAGDDSSNVATMLELARGLSQSARGFKNSVIFLFNTGEEEGLNGAHSFITQHPWSNTVRIAVDLEAMGIGGKSGIFQTGPESLAVENFAATAKYPSGQIIAQDLFSSGVINSATDFQVYQEIGGLSGLDFAFTDKTAVYHTRNDKFELLKPGSLQHLGENMLGFLIQVSTSTDLTKNKAVNGEESSEDNSSVYFDILGRYMIVYRKQLGKMLNKSVIMLSLSIWSIFLYMGGVAATVSLALSCLSIILMWILSLSSSLLVAFILSFISSSAVPYIRCPWLVVGLFGSPSLIGALGGQHIGFKILQMYLSTVYSKGKKDLSLSDRATLAKTEAERWLYKAGIAEWLVLLFVSDYLNIGSSYIPLIWLVFPVFAYGLLEATLSSAESPKPLKIATLFMGLSVPIVVSAGPIIRIIGVIIGTTMRLDSNPGSVADWLVNVLVAAIVAAVVCLMLVYLISYVHLSDAGRSIIGAALVLFGLSLAAILSGLVPPYTEDFARTVQVVHVVDTTGTNGTNQVASSYISLSSLTPGKLIKEAEEIGEGFVCGRNMSVDFVTFSVNYGCLSYVNDENGWSTEQDVPTLHVESDVETDNKRVTQVSVGTKSSTRWALAVNTQQIDDFEFKVGSEEWVPLGNKNSVDGWHFIQFAGGKDSPTNFTLTLHWPNNNSSLRLSGKKDNNVGEGESQRPLLKLRTDVRNLTTKAQEVLIKLPYWCSLYGKSTSPYNVAFLADLPVDFKKPS